MEPATKLLEENNRQKRTLWHYIAYVIGFMSFLWLILIFIPIREKPKHPMFENDRPLVMAHRGGADLAPENTLAAFRHAVNLDVDLIELDIHLTKDGHIVAIHDDTIDRTTDGTGRVNDLTLAEIKSYDASIHFVDPDGNNPFREGDVTIPTLEAVFQEMPLDMRYTIEIKDTNDPELYEKIGKDLWELMGKYDVQDKVLIGSFDQNILDMMIEITDGEAIVSAGKLEVTKFVLLHKLRLQALYRTKVDSIEMPIKAAGINLVDKTIINKAQKRGMDVHYWTINDRETMEELINLGVDGIITNRPDLLIELIDETVE